MDRVNCVKCKHEVEINLSNATDENGEVFKCPNCGYKFRYVKE